MNRNLKKVFHFNISIILIFNNYFKKLNVFSYIFCFLKIFDSLKVIKFETSLLIYSIRNYHRLYYQLYLKIFLNI